MRAKVKWVSLLRKATPRSVAVTAVLVSVQDISEGPALTSPHVELSLHTTGKAELSLSCALTCAYTLLSWSESHALCCRCHCARSGRRARRPCEKCMSRQCGAQSAHLNVLAFVPLCQQ